MTHFIELTQFLGDKNTRKIKIAIEQICFYYENRIVFNSRAIDVRKSYEEITNLIKKQYISDTGKKKQIRYVHELQHALRLFGIEKEFE